MREVRRPEKIAKVAQGFSQTRDSAAAKNSENSLRSASLVETSSQPTALSRETLSTIRDNTYFRVAEKAAWFELWAKLQNTPEEEMVAQSMGTFGYVQLQQQPDVYRGRVVTVNGTVRQVTVEQPAENELGINSYFRLVVQPSGGEIWPIFVYCLNLPNDFPRGDGVAIDVSATGYFFKNLSYSWRDGLGIAPVVLAKGVARIQAGSPPDATASVARSPIVADLWGESGAEPKSNAPSTTAELAEILALAGWSAKRLATFMDDQPLATEQAHELLQLLWRVRTFDALSVSAWTRNDISVAALAAEPEKFRGQFLRFVGRVQQVREVALSAADAKRLEMPCYYLCELALAESAGNVTVLATDVPSEWSTAESLDEPATAAGLFIKRLPSDGGLPNVLLVAERVTGNSFGRSVLTSLGMDVSLLDGIRNHRTILPDERDAFYQLLDAVGHVGAHQLIRFAQQNIAVVAKSWEAELEAAELPRRAMAQEVQRRAEEGSYSVAPLFNDADRQIGQLIVVDGTARRIVRVNVGRQLEDARPVKATRQPSLDHYYEMEVFTDDSQNRPLVFCVRDLPPAMPTGDDLHEPVRVAGFFFKSWRYRTRDASETDEAGKVDPFGKLLIAPLVIGRGPVRLKLEQSGGQVGELVGGGLFVLALAGIWAMAWWFARGDRQFRRRTAAAVFSLPAGESLDELQVPPVGTPMK
jgi:hypothetical protein